ncbi:MAG: hypothetical protein AAGF12_31935 [Myxococcota bacterium]
MGKPSLYAIAVVTALLAACAPANPSTPVDSVEALDEAEFLSAPPTFAVPGAHYEYATLAELPGRGALTYHLLQAPEGMMVNSDGVIRWTPTDAHVGAHPVAVELRRGRETIRQSFDLRVLARRLLGELRAGTMADPESRAPVVDIDVPEEAGPGTVMVYAVDAQLPDGPRELSPVGSALAVETDLAPGTAITLRFQVPTELVGETKAFLTAYPQRQVRRGPGGAFGLSPHPSVRAPGALTVTTRARPAEAMVFQINEGRSTELHADEFHIQYFLEPDEDPGASEGILRAIANDLQVSRDYLLALGCEFAETQDVYIHDLGGDRGRVTEGTRSLEIDRIHIDEDPRSSVQATVAHELIHVFQLIVLGAFPLDRGEDFWIEGNAEYGADEVFNGNDYLSAVFEPYDGSVTGKGLYDWQGIHSYQLVAFWKSVKAQHGGFNVCEMIDAYMAEGENGLAALSSILGGDETRVDTYANFVAAWNHVRSPELLEDADQWFGDGSRPEFVTAIAPGEAGAFRWEDSMHHIPGGQSARFDIASAGPVTIRVESPVQGFLGLVFDEMHMPLGRLEPGGAPLELAVEGPIYVDLAARQDGTVEFGPDQQIVVVVEPGDGGSACEPVGAPCGGSGSTFDDECCGDAICVVGACQAPNRREGESCEAPDHCARGLACGPVGSAEAERTCCARDTDYCKEKADCCGLMDCVSNRCVGRESGEQCVLGDCTGGSFCDPEAALCL